MFVVWAGPCFIVLLFGLGRVLFFAVWAMAPPTPKKRKQKTRPKQQKQTNKQTNTLTGDAFTSVYIYRLFVTMYLCVAFLGVVSG